MSHHTHLATLVLILALALAAASAILPWWAVVGAAAVGTIGFGLLARTIRRSLGAPPMMGKEGLPGAKGVVAQAPLPWAPDMYLVRVSGELWSAESPEALREGDRVLVLGSEGNRLVVCKWPAELELVGRF
jgi:membrane protein implicated in regulation of membrane protease activity